MIVHEYVAVVCIRVFGFAVFQEYIDVLWKLMERIYRCKMMHCVLMLFDFRCQFDQR